MRIAFLITRSDAIGGAQVHVRDLARQLLLDGHEVKVLYGGDGVFRDMLKGAGVRCQGMRRLVRPISLVRDFLTLFEIRAALKEFAPEILSTHSSKAGVLGRIAGKSLGVPTLFTAHGWAFTEGVGGMTRCVYRWVERLCKFLSNGVITVSAYDRDLAISNRVTSSHKIQVVHNGVPDVEDHLLADPTQHPARLVMVARFEEPKDHSLLLRALSEVTDLDWTLDLVGDGPLQCAMIALSENLGLSTRVRFLGSRSDVAEILARSDIFVLTTHWEGFPRSILEAMRAGLPLVATRVGGVPESVVDGVTGLLVGRSDLNDLSQALRRLIIDPQLRTHLGRQARSRYKAEFTFERMYQETVSVYRTFLESEKVVLPV